MLRDQGYFFVGGKYFTAPDGQFMADQMYVSYQIPQNLKHPYPIIFIHGGGLTGTYFEGTPDGREGWTTFFVRQGHSVYNVDQVTRGRSAYHADVYGSAGRTNVLGVEQSFTVPELFNRYPQAHLHTQWLGSGLPGDPIFDQFYASEVPQTNNAVMRIDLMRDATAALLERIGPAILDPPYTLSVWPVLADRGFAARPRRGDRYSRGHQRCSLGSTDRAADLVLIWRRDFSLGHNFGAPYVRPPPFRIRCS